MRAKSLACNLKTVCTVLGLSPFGQHAHPQHDVLPLRKARNLASESAVRLGVHGRCSLCFWWSILTERQRQQKIAPPASQRSQCEEWMSLAHHGTNVAQPSSK